VPELQLENLKICRQEQYKINRVADVRLAPSLKGGGLGMRYTVRIRGKEVYLFEDEGKWFVGK
jgi:hypothetical protein